MWIPIIFISYILQHVLLLADSGPGGGGRGAAPQQKLRPLEKSHYFTEFPYIPRRNLKYVENRK